MLAPGAGATERRRAEERLSHIARYDQLTGLVNRDLFGDRLDRALARSARSGKPVALMFVDLDRFKDVNDTLGHDAGDELLKEAANRIRRRVRGTDTVARLGGDEFAVILKDLTDGRDAVAAVAADVLGALAEPVSLGGREIPLTASIGTAVHPPSPGGDLVKKLEITESSLMEGLPSGRKTFEGIKDVLDGIRISVDDFGTGYSSLTYLKNLPVDTLKIGPPFVSGVPDDPGDVAIATSMIGLTRSLRLDAIVEGVETAEQLAFAREQGCSLAQGYFFGCPVPAEDFARLLGEGRPAPFSVGS